MNYLDINLHFKNLSQLTHIEIQKSIQNFYKLYIKLHTMLEL